MPKFLKLIIKASIQLKCFSFSTIKINLSFAKIYLITSVNSFSKNSLLKLNVKNFSVLLVQKNVNKRK